jgi:hypothetical protein
MTILLKKLQKHDFIPKVSLMIRARGSSKASEALVEQQLATPRGCEDAEKVCRDQWKNKYGMKVGPAIGYKTISSSSSLPCPNSTVHSLRVAMKGPAHGFICKAIVDTM